MTEASSSNTPSASGKTGSATREENKNKREVIKREESKNVEKERCETVVEDKKKGRERKGEMS